MIKDLERKLNDSLAPTENGALAYKTTGKKLLDLNFAVGSFRNKGADYIYNMFYDAYCEDKELAMKWLFFCRDCRGGIGERNAFRVVIKRFAEEHGDELKKVLHLIPEYGRWDDLLCLLDGSLKDDVIVLIYNQLIEDITSCANNKPISLLAKWLPSCNASSKKTRRYASILFNGMGFTKKFYIKLVKDLRKYLDVLEVKISNNKWSEVNYETVPSYANLLYSHAFMNHDEERRLEFLQKLSKGETKINAEVLFPHDIVHKYWSIVNQSMNNFDNHILKKYDATLEELWNNLPDYVKGENNTLVIRDGSGSMRERVGNTGIMAIEVSTALAIYFSERCTGEFKDKFITFSSSPELVDLSSASSLFRKIEICRKYSDWTNTDINKTFELFLDVAIENNYTQEDLPKNLLIISDMEFDNATTYYYSDDSRNIALFKKIKRKYEKHGYKLPRLVFWNVCSRTNLIPVKENDMGVTLVSGFSPAVLNMVLTDELDPYKCLLYMLNNDRYKIIGELLDYD